MRGLARGVLARVVSIAVSVVLGVGPALQGVGLAFAEAAQTPVPMAETAAAPEAPTPDATIPPSIATSNQPEAEQTSPADVPPSFDEHAKPTVIREAKELEDDSTRVFEMSDGTFRSELHTGPFQTEVAEDVFVPADASLAVGDGFGTYGTVACPAEAEFAPTWDSDQVRVTRSGVSVTMNLVGSHDVAPIALDDEVLYPGIDDGATLLCETGKSGVKQTVRLADRQSESTYSFDMSVSGGKVVSAGSGLAIKRDEAAEPTFYIGALKVFDSAGSVCETATTSVCELRTGVYRFTYAVPQSWLDSAERVFPVSVDPDIIVDQDTFVSQVANASYVTEVYMATGRYTDAADQNRRAYMRFNPSDGRMGQYVHDATMQVYCSYIQCESRTYLGEAAYWNPGDLTWSNKPAYTPISSKLLPDAVGWSYWDVTNLAQRWVRPIDPDSWTSHTLQLYQNETGGQLSAHYKRFNTENATSYHPKVMVSDERPNLVATTPEDRYSLSGSDIVTVTVSAQTAWPEDVRSIRFRVNGVDDNERSRGEMRWYSYEPTESGLSAAAIGPGEGWASYVTSDSAYTTPLLQSSSFTTATAAGATTMTATFAFKVNDNWGEVQDNRIDTRIVMGRGADTYDTGWTTGTASFNVVPTPVVPSSVEATCDGLDWFVSSDGNPALSPDDTKRQGRGFVNLGWSPRDGALGYNIWANDGVAWRQVGSTFGNESVTWTSEGTGLYPTDSSINTLTASPVSGLRGSSPSLASRISTMGASTKNKAQIVVSDGSSLYARSSVDSTSWARVTSGLKGTPSGVSTTLVGPRLPAARSAFYLDGHLYSGCTSSTGSTLKGVWVNAEPSQGATLATALFSDPLLVASTGLEASADCTDVLVATNGRTIYSVAEMIESGYDGWKVRPYQWDSSHREAAMLEERLIEFPSYRTASVIAEDGFLTFIEDTSSPNARVTRVRTDTWQVIGQWRLGLANPGSGAWDQANDCIWIPNKVTGELWRTTATGVDLRDNPSPLYSKTRGVEADPQQHYEFAVTSFNSGGDSDLTTVTPLQLPARSRSGHDDPRHTSVSLGSAQGNSIAAKLDDGAMTVDVTDLSIASWGPGAGVSRHYDSGPNAGTGSFAPGWRFDFEQRIDSVSTTEVVWTDGSGERHSFVASDGVYYSPNGLPSTLTSDGVAWHLAFKDHTAIRFDGATGSIASVTDRNGNNVAYLRDIFGRVTQIIAANDQSIMVNRDVIDPDKVTSVSYETANGIRMVSYEASDAVVHHFVGDNDESHTVDYDYDGDCRLNQLTVAASGVATATWDVTYDGAGRCERIDLPEVDGTRSGASIVYGDGHDATVSSLAKVSGQLTTISTEYQWNLNGTLKQKSDPHIEGGPLRWWYYTYGSGNEVIQEDRPSGASVRRTMDASGNATYSWDEEGHLTSVIYEDSLPKTITDPRGCTTSNRYDAKGNLLSSSRVLNATEFSRAEATYTPTGFVQWQRTLISEVATQSRWVQSEYVYDPVCGQPTQQTISAGTMTRVAFGDYQSWETTAIDLGMGVTTSTITTRRTYDEFGNVTGEWDAAGVQQLCDPVYGISGRLEASTDVDAVRSITEYDALGRETSSSAVASSGALNDRGLIVYDVLGRPVVESALTSRGAVNTSVTHRYEVGGREELTIDSIEGTTTTLFDHFGQVTSMWAPGADVASATAATRAVYDLDGRVTSEYAPGVTSATVNAYYPNGLLKQTTDPDGSWELYFYDQGGNLTETRAATEDKDASGKTVTVSEYTLYDVGGRPVRSISSEGFATNTLYDLAGRVVRSSTGVGATESTASVMAYNDLGWELSSSGVDGITKTTGYDVLGNVVRAVTKDASGTVTEDTTNHYDSKKRLSRADTVEGSSTASVIYGYDEFGRVKEEKHVKDSVTSRWITRVFDEFSRETHVEDKISGIVHDYDYALGSKKQSTDTATYGSVRSSSVSDGSGRETTQSAIFQITGAAAATRTIDWDTTRNLPKTSTLVVKDPTVSSSVALTMSYGFDKADKLTSMTGGAWGTGGVKVSYNTTGTASKVGDEIGLPFGPSSTVTTTTRAFKYTKAGRLASAKVGSRSISYTWNASGSGDLEKVIDNGLTTTFAYSAGRLKGVKSGGGVTQTVTFDLAGRRSLESSGTSGNANFVRTAYEWTGADILRSWSGKRGIASSMTAEYLYDSEGQRTTATVNAPSAWSRSSVLTTYTYGWEGLSLCWLEAKSETVTARLTYLFDETERPYAASYEAIRSGVATSAVFRLLTTDHGDVVGLASAGGQVFGRYQYGPFGEAEASASTTVTGVSAALAAEITSFQPLRYAGYDFDTWSGQYYLQARYYDPATKQFISKDPAEDDGEESAYQYCSGDPVQMVDPTGMWSWGGVFRSFKRAVRRTYNTMRRTLNRAVRRVKTVARVAFRTVRRAVRNTARRVRRWAATAKANVRRYYGKAKRRFNRAVKAAKAKAKAVAKGIGKAASAAAGAVMSLGVEEAGAAETVGPPVSPLTPDEQSKDLDLLQTTLSIAAAAGFAAVALGSSPVIGTAAAVAGGVALGIGVYRKFVMKDSTYSDLEFGLDVVGVGVGGVTGSMSKIAPLLGTGACDVAQLCAISVNTIWAGFSIRKGIEGE